MSLTISGHQSLYSAPPYAKPTPIDSPATSSWDGWKTTESWSHLHSGMVLRPTARYESDRVPLTDTCLVASRPSSLASARKRPEASLMLTLRERNVKLTSYQAAGATEIGTATCPQHSPPLVGQDLVSWIPQGDQAPDSKAPSSLLTYSTQVTRTTGTLGGKSFTGINCTQICMVGNTWSWFCSIMPFSNHSSADFFR